MYSAQINSARQAGEDWVVLVDRQWEEDGQTLGTRIEMHLDTGVAVTSRIYRDELGRLRYATESYFLNRRTGQELACGSRKWNQGVFDSQEALQKAVAAAKADVYQRFAGLIAIQRRQK